MCGERVTAVGNHSGHGAKGPLAFGVWVVPNECFVATAEGTGRTGSIVSPLFYRIPQSPPATGPSWVTYALTV